MKNTCNKIVGKKMILTLIVIVVSVFFIKIFTTDKSQYSIAEGTCGYYDGHYECHYSWTDKIVLSDGTVIKYKDIKSWNDFLRANGEFIQFPASWLDTPVGYGKWIIGDKSSVHYLINKDNVCDYYCNYFKNEGNV